MKVLFITHHYLEDIGGGCFASRAFVKAFSSISERMILLFPSRTGNEELSFLPKEIEKKPVTYNLCRLGKLINLFTGKVHRFYEIAKEWADSTDIDTVVFDTSVVSAGIIRMFKKKNVKIIVIHHNYQYEYFRDNTPLLLLIPTLYWCRKYEGEAVRTADLNITLTNQDKQLLAKHYNNGNDSNFSTLGIFESEKNIPLPAITNQVFSTRFVITGDLSAIQTKRCIKHWIKKYYPVLHDVFPNASLTIAGRHPEKKLYSLCLRNGINLIASPESLDPILANADYYICPIYLGGGIKLRIMDGLKYGLPVITHSVSARGYDSSAGKDFIFQYHSVEEFKQRLEEIKNCSFNRDAVRNTYLSAFSLESGCAKLREIIDKKI